MLPCAVEVRWTPGAVLDGLPPSSVVESPARDDCWQTTKQETVPAAGVSSMAVCGRDEDAVAANAEPSDLSTYLAAEAEELDCLLHLILLSLQEVPYQNDSVVAGERERTEERTDVELDSTEIAEFAPIPTHHHCFFDGTNWEPAMT